MNNWNRIREFYRERLPEIMAEEQCEWGMHAYEWEDVLRLTPIEEWLWGDIRECNAVLYPQFPVGRFFVDFANPKAKVAIECDGAAFHKDKAKDAARDVELRAAGWHVYRITGSDCRTEDDEETGAMGRAHRFVYEITERHLIGRHHRPVRASDGWVHWADWARA